jgi:hypothetical protein
VKKDAIVLVTGADARLFDAALKDTRPRVRDAFWDIAAPLAIALMCLFDFIKGHHVYDVILGTANLVLVLVYAARHLSHWWQYKKARAIVDRFLRETGQS